MPYLFAATHLLLKKEISFLTAVKLGFLVTLPGDIVKAALAILIFGSARERLGLPVGKG